MLQSQEADLAFVVSDLGEGIACGSSARISQYLRERQSSLTIGVALMPFSFGGHIMNANAAQALIELKKACDSVVVVHSANLRQDNLHGANFLQLYETFLDMIAFNVYSLVTPLLRSNDLIKVSLPQFKQIFKQDHHGRAREAKLVCVQVEEGAQADSVYERGKMALQSCLTDRFFPVNDISDCFGILASIEAPRDMTFGEIEQIMELSSYISKETILIQGLSYQENRKGLQLTLCVVSDSSFTPEELEQENRRKLFEIEANKKDWKHYWRQAKEWF